MQTTHNTKRGNENMNLNQIEVISKLFYGKKCNLNLPYGERVRKMMKEDVKFFRACKTKSDELGVHKVYENFEAFMSGN